MDLVAQQITIDVIGMAAFDRDLQATVRKPQADVHPHAAAASANNSTDGSSSEAINSSSSSSNKSGSGRGIAGRGGEVLEVMRHLVVAMQARNNPLNRWFPWRKVCTGIAQRCNTADSLCKHTARCNQIGRAVFLCALPVGTVTCL
jgi:hypothetical protein